MIIIIRLFIIYVPGQQLQDQLQIQHGGDIDNYIMDKHNMNSRVRYRKVRGQKHNNTENQTNKQVNK
jgi:hypothetical protein